MKYNQNMIQIKNYMANTYLPTDLNRPIYVVIINNEINCEIISVILLIGKFFLYLPKKRLVQKINVS